MRPLWRRSSRRGGRHRRGHRGHCRLAVNVTHQGITGCVVSGPNGPELETSDKRYALEGDAASIKVGDRVKIRGSRVKKTKDQTGDQVYRGEKLRKDYGPCPVGKSAS